MTRKNKLFWDVNNDDRAQFKDQCVFLKELNTNQCEKNIFFFKE